MKLFPYTLIRSGGGSFETFANFSPEIINTITTKLLHTRARESQDREQLCDQLLSFMQALTEQEQQQTLHNLRRDIFKGKPVKERFLTPARSILTGEVALALEDYLVLKEELASLEGSYEADYQAELAKSRDAFKQVAQDKNLQKGLILSSRVLLDRIPSYVQRDALKFRKKENQVEQSLLKYATRMYTKTSPFSTFTNLGIMELGEHEGEGYAMSHNGRAETEQVVSHIRLNNYLFKYLYDLFVSYRDIYRWLLLRPNPTTDIKEDHFFYLTNHANIESFQRIPFSDVVNLILDVAKGDSKGVRYKDLIANLMEYIEAEEADLEEYVNQLISYGLLEYNVGVSGIDPNWDQPLVETLKPLAAENVPFAAEVIEMLKTIRQQAEKYGSADLTERKGLLKEAYDNFTAVAFKIHEAAGLPEEERMTPPEREAWQRKKREEEQAKKEAEEAAKAEGEAEEKPADANEEEEASEEEEVFQIKSQTTFTYKPEQMFFEDTTRELDGNFDTTALADIMSRLSNTMQEMRWTSGQMVEREKMKSYFEIQYGKEARVNLLTFYEEFFRDYKKPEREREEREKMEKARRAEADATNENAIKSIEEDEERKKANPPKEPLKLSLKKTETRNANTKKWNEAMSEFFKTVVSEERDEVNVELAAVQQEHQKMELDTKAHEQANFFGSFVQFFHNEGKAGKEHFHAVINGTFSGYGKMLSRFMHIFDPKVTEELRSWNVMPQGDQEMFIEDCDASYFNANLHPPLMPFEVWMPGGHNSLPSDKQIPITDFEIVYHAEEDELNLIHKPSGKRAYVFDLGFQGQMGRSQLFQLLEKFTRAEYLFTHSLVTQATSIYRSKLRKAQKDAAEKRGEEKDKKEPTVLMSPRVTLENKLILQRKTWMFPLELLPEREPTDTDAVYFARVAAWRQEHELPAEVFVFINPDRMGNSPVPREKMQRLTRDDYKPQYINFNNPILVLLFEKMLVKVPETLKIQEMRPSSNELLKIDGERYVSEFMVQWYNK